jgi:hypothetical protein
VISCPENYMIYNSLPLLFTGLGNPHTLAGETGEGA